MTAARGRARRRQRVVVAMSGGVDSSTAAALLVEAGHDVVGIAIRTHAAPAGGNRACCTPDDMRDARRVADLLDIPFYLIDQQEAFADAVVAPFVADYLAGRTPNPCVACNDRIKFPPLWQRARALGATALATGHYARLARRAGTVRLRRARDAHKDQSYFMCRLAPELLPHLRFPLGNLTKAQTRAAAARLGLPVADKAESQEICFVGAGGYAATVERLAAELPAAGPVCDADGAVLGRHQGVHRYTLGQRRGLPIATPQAHVVTHLDAARATVTVGPRAALLARRLVLHAMVWSGPPPGPRTALTVQLRHRDRGHAARLVAHDAAGRAEVVLAQPTMRPAPGQAVAIYHGDVLLGGGTATAAPLARTPRASAEDGLGVAARRAGDIAPATSATAPRASADDGLGAAARRFGDTAPATPAQPAADPAPRAGTWA